MLTYFILCGDDLSVEYLPEKLVNLDEYDGVLLLSHVVHHLHLSPVQLAAPTSFQKLGFFHLNDVAFVFDVRLVMAESFSKLFQFSVEDKGALAPYELVLGGQGVRRDLKHKAVHVLLLWLPAKGLGDSRVKTCVVEFRRVRDVPALDGRRDPAHVRGLAVEICQNVHQVLFHILLSLGQVDGHAAAVVVQQGVGAVAQQCLHSLAARHLHS